MQETPGELPPRLLKLELFTDYHRLIGALVTAELRTNGVLNSAEPQLWLEQVSTSPLLRPGDETIASGFARVSKESIILAVPNDEHEIERLARATKIYNRGELLQHRVLVVLGNYQVSGNLHLHPELELNQAMLYRNEFFIGMTDATVNFLPEPSIRFTASSVLINRGRVDFMCGGAP